MPGLISVAEFLEETREDYNSPTTSTFVSKMPQCRQTVAALEETLDFDRDGLTKMKKAVKAIYNSGNSHVDDEMYLSRALEKLGGSALSKDQEPDVGAAFLKFSVVTKELSALMKTLMQNVNNIVMFPLDNLLKGDLREVKGDLKRPFDRACKEYETKFGKLEKEKKQQAKEAGLIRSEVTPAEVADEMEKERKMFQLQMCEYLIKVNEIKTKKGVDLLQHLVEYYHAQTNYFQDGLKTIEHFGTYVQDLSSKLQKIRQKQDEERKRLWEIRLLLKNSPGLDSTPSSGTAGGSNLSSASLGGQGGGSLVGGSMGSLSSGGGGGGGSIGSAANPPGYSLHQLQGDKQHGYSRVGHLLKKSEGKMRKVWQKRRCEVRDGFLDISHADEAKPPTRVNLLTCQIKMVSEDKRCFDLVSYNRTYHFQAEDEADQVAWMSVLVNCKEGALMKAFDDSGKSGTSKANQSVRELQQAVIKYVLQLPGNDRCCDCNSTNDATWLSTNFGIIVCIECSGVHRDLGVHISRIQSLTLDNVGTSQLLLARTMTNSAFNEVMEATLHAGHKPTPQSSMEERYEFIRAKYVDRKYCVRTCGEQRDLLNDVEHAVTTRDLHHLLQAFAEGADLSHALPSSELGETALHLAVSSQDGVGQGSTGDHSAYSLHVVDFLVQNSSSLDVQTTEGNTPLHYCVLLERSECIKLLLRSGANPNIENRNRKTPLDVARERGSTTCEELLCHALQHKKGLFDNVNVDWNLSPEDGSTDFSDDDGGGGGGGSIVGGGGGEGGGGELTPERSSKTRSRPPSFAGGGGSGGGGGESPVSLRSRSSTCDSLKSGLSPSGSVAGGGVKGGQMAPPPPPQNRKPSLVSMNPHSSLKKRAAPLPPGGSVGNVAASAGSTTTLSSSSSSSSASSGASSVVVVGGGSGSGSGSGVGGYATLPNSHSRTASDPTGTPHHPSSGSSSSSHHLPTSSHHHHFHPHPPYHPHLPHHPHTHASAIALNHRRSPSSDSSSLSAADLSGAGLTPRSHLASNLHAVGARLVLPPGEVPTLKSTTAATTPSSSSSPATPTPSTPTPSAVAITPTPTTPTSGPTPPQTNNNGRPRGPPPPTPPPTAITPSSHPTPTSTPSATTPHSTQRLSNGRSNESISSLSSDVESVGSMGQNPVPPPRKFRNLPRRFTRTKYVSHVVRKSPKRTDAPSASERVRGSSIRRCRALYDCDADNEDELSFREGEVILITNEQTDDENWMEGAIESDPARRGMFPVSFVHMLGQGQGTPAGAGAGPGQRSSGGGQQPD